jgi:hypothetical protein
MLKPGTYVNKRGEELELVPSDNENLLMDREGKRFYSHTGTCMFWSIISERYFMDTDPKADLKLTPSPHKCESCNRPF